MNIPLRTSTDHPGRSADRQRALQLPPLFADSVVYGLGSVASRFVGLLLVPLYTRVFTPADYGLLDVLLASSVVVYILSELQIVSAVARGYYEALESGRLSVLLGTAATLYVRLALFWTLAASLLFALLRHLLPSGIGWIQFAPIVLLLLPQQILSLLQTVLRFQRRAGVFVGFAVADVATSGLGSATAIFVFHSGIAGVLWALVFSKVIWASLLLYKMRGVIGWKFDRSYAREILAYGLPTVPSVLTKWGQNYANRYVLAVQLSLAQLGLFSLAIQMSGVVALIDSAFRQAWDTRAMQKFGGHGNEGFFVRTLNCYLAGMFLVCSGVALFAVPLVGLIAGPKFAPSTPIVGFLVFGQMWNGATNVLGSGNAWARRTYWNAAGFGGGAVLNVVALFVLAPRWGVLAAGVTYLAGATTAAWLVLMTAQRSHRIPYTMPIVALATFGSVTVAYGSYHWSSGVDTHDFTLARIIYAAAVWLGLATVVAVVTIVSTTGTRSGPWFRPSSYLST